MTDVDFFRLSGLFQLGIKFLHGGMLSIFDALVYLSLTCIHFFVSKESSGKINGERSESLL